MALRRKTEVAIADLSATADATAADVFATMGAVLGSEKIESYNMRNSKLLRTHYVARLAEVWRQAGLSPSRATHPENLSYKSSFHRYTELVLTGMAEPWAKRHNGEVVLKTLREDIRRAHADLPGEIRSSVSAALRRADHEWLIADEYLKEALRSAIQISDCKVP